jgi:hypothetical protein
MPKRGRLHKTFKISLMENAMEKLINEIVEAIIKETFSCPNNDGKTRVYGVNKAAKAALAAIQKDYVIVEKGKVEIVDNNNNNNNNITLHIGDLLQGKKLYTQIVDRFMLTNQDYYADYKIIQRNGKPAINKTDIVSG